MTGPTRGPMQSSGSTTPPSAPVGLSEVLRKAGAGDDAAWRELVGLYGRRVFALARSRVGSLDLAEEITQSVFVTIASKLKHGSAEDGAGGYTEQGKFESWLFRIAMNRVRDEARRRKRHAEPTDPEQFDTFNARPAAANPGADSEVRSLRLAMAQLSDTDREVIELRHHGGLSFAQMAEMLGEPLGTLLARHHRALKKLKDLITGGGAPAGRLVEDDA